MVRDILRLGIYQLLHLDRVPAAAVVDDAVSMVRAARKSSASGFANAVLRRISRSRRVLGLPPRPAVLDADDASLAYLSTTLSHPRWLVERWVARCGADATERWLQFNNAPAPLTLRAHTPAERQGERRRGAAWIRRRDTADPVRSGGTDGRGRPASCSAERAPVPAARRSLATRWTPRHRRDVPRARSMPAPPRAARP